MSVSVPGFALHKAKGRNGDMYILFRQEQEGAGQRLGLFGSEAAAWARAAAVSAKDAASVMTPAAGGTSERLVRP